MVNVNDAVEVGTVLMTITPCQHPAMYNNICASCGENRTNIAGVSSDSNRNGSDGATGTAAYHMKSSQGLLKLSLQEADRVANQQYDSLTSMKKLALVLDIDHTIAHCIEYNPTVERACRDGSITHRANSSSNTDTDTGADADADADADVAKLAVTPSFECAVHVLELAREGPGGGCARYMVKFRPFLAEFLRVVSEQYQITLYTNGTRKYAEAISGLLDPDNKLFNRRIVARTDMPSVGLPSRELSAFSAADLTTMDYSNFDNPTFSAASNIHQGVYDGNKSLSLLFLNATSLVVVVDDRDDVWGGRSSVVANEDKPGDIDSTPAPSSSAINQLLLIEPYCFFKDGVEAYDRTTNNAVSTTTVAGSGTTTSGKMRSNANAGSFHESDDILLRYLDILKFLHYSTYGFANARGDDNASMADDLIRSGSGSDASSSSSSSSSSAGNEKHKSIIPTMVGLKRSVLKGCHLQFQGYWHKSAGPSEIRSNKYVQLALGLGASVEGLDSECDAQYSGSVTHVISKCLDLDHILWSYYCSQYRIHGYEQDRDWFPETSRYESPLPLLYIVTADWLVQSVFRLKRADETLYRKYTSLPPFEPPARELRSIETLPLSAGEPTRKRSFDETFQSISDEGNDTAAGSKRAHVESNGQKPVVYTSCGDNDDSSDDDDFDNWCSSL